jgi:drug/metabolite transporter (DMT)-like permease
MNPTKGGLAGIALLVGCNLIWSTNFIVGRLLRNSVDPFSLTALRWIIGCAIYPLMFGPKVLKRLKISAKPFTLGVLGITLFSFTLYTALSIEPATLVGLLYGLTPVVILVTGWVVRLEKLQTLQLIGSAVSVIGVMIFLNGGLSGIHGLTPLGLLTALGPPVIWGIYTVAQRRLTNEREQAEFTYSSMVLSLPVTAIVALPYLIPHLAAGFPLHSWMLMLWLGLGPSALAYYMWNKGVSIVGAYTAGPFSNLLPPATAIFGFLLLGETITITEAVGGVLIVAGSLAASVAHVKNIRGAEQ